MSWSQLSIIFPDLVSFAGAVKMLEVFKKKKKKEQKRESKPLWLQQIPFT